MSLQVLFHLLLASGPQLVPVKVSTGVATALVAVTMLTHVQFAAFQQGGYTILAVSDFLGWKRKDPHYERFSSSLVKVLGAAFAFGGAIAIFGVMIIFNGLWAHFYVSLQRVLFWPFVAEALAFVGEIICLYTLYANWDRLAQARPLRLGVEILLAVNGLIQFTLIDIIASYMLTPRPSLDLAGNLINPTEIPLNLHRMVGNVAFAGGLIALSAGGRLLFTKVKEKRAYLDWMGHYGMIYAIGFTLTQPLIGWAYAKEIQLHAYASWYDMMLGGLSVAFMFQVFLLGLIFTVGIYYLWRRVRSSGFRSPALGISVLLSLGAWALISTPYSLSWSYESVFAANANVPIWQGGLIIPWGAMIPWKITALVTFTFVSIFALTIYAKHVSVGRLRWGDATRGQAAALVTVGVAIVLIMALMGFIRENSRGPFLITNKMLINQQQNFVPTQQAGPALGGQATNSTTQNPSG